MKTMSNLQRRKVEFLQMLMEEQNKAMEANSPQKLKRVNLEHRRMLDSEKHGKLEQFLENRDF